MYGTVFQHAILYKSISFYKCDIDAVLVVDEPLHVDHGLTRSSTIKIEILDNVNLHVNLYVWPRGHRRPKWLLPFSVSSKYVQWLQWRSRIYSYIVSQSIRGEDGEIKKKNKLSRGI